MEKVTITLDKRTLRRARTHATRGNMSLSRFVGDVLRRHMESNEYEQAMHQYLSSDLVIHRLPRERPARDDLHG